MTGFGGFNGFPRECIEFYRDLARNNNTAWFAEHKTEFEQYVIMPARTFIMEMGDRLSIIAPAINADPRVNHSIFRIYRDTRFSRDKTPYKTHLGIWFWEGSAPRMESSGFYFHLEPDHLILGAGIYRFPAAILEKYRKYVIHGKYGAALVSAIAEIESHGPYTLGGIRYKRIPRGYDPKHPNAALLLHDGLWIGMDTAVPNILFSPDFTDYCMELFTHVAPVHRWLMNLLE